MSEIEKFKEKVKKDNIECPLCAAKTILDFSEYEFQAQDTMLKFTFYCRGCNLTFSGYIY